MLWQTKRLLYLGPMLEKFHKHREGFCLTYFLIHTANNQPLYSFILCVQRVLAIIFKTLKKNNQEFLARRHKIYHEVLCCQNKGFYIHPSLA